MTMAVRLLASIPAVTCSAVEADPNPLGPALPVINEKIPISLNRTKKQAKPQNLSFCRLSPHYSIICLRERHKLTIERERDYFVFFKKKVEQGRDGERGSPYA